MLSLFIELFAWSTSALVTNVFTNESLSCFQIIQIVMFEYIALLYSGMDMDRHSSAGLVGHKATLRMTWFGFQLVRLHEGL